MSKNLLLKTNLNFSLKDISLQFLFFALLFFAFTNFSNAQSFQQKKERKVDNNKITDYGTRHTAPDLNSESNGDATALQAAAQAAELDPNNTYNNPESFMACDGTYCVPSFDSSVFPITRVIFSTINNPSPNIIGGIDREGFCNTAAVTKGQTYNISIQGNTSGNNNFYERAYFDWNQNNIFGDVPNEIYSLGILTGSNGIDGVTLTAPINVPSAALNGVTRMRVMHRFAGYPTSACQTGAGYGQAEDYNVLVSNPTSYCEPESLNDESSLYFDDVEFIGTLNDVSNFGNGFSSAGSVGYQDHTGLANSIQAQGEGMNVFVESTFRGHIKAWVDWNSNFSFETSELVFDSGAVATSSTTFGFVIPPAQPVGDYTIRIRTYNSFHYTSGAESYIYDYDACEDFFQNGPYDEFGETEDYSFTVIESCAAIIDSITEASNCGPGSVTLSATGSTGTILYRWYANEGDTTPIATSATGDFTTPALATTTDFYVTAVSATCESLVKSKVTATIREITSLTFTPSVPEVCGEDDTIELSASAANEVAYLIDEDFEGAGLGVFTNNNIVDNGAAENNITMWTQRTSTFIPSEQVWFPAVSSGFGANQFAMATSDAGTTNITENALESGVLDSSTFTDLTLNFDMYFSRYIFAATPDIPENVNIEVSTNGGTTWNSIQLYDDDLGYGTDFTSVSLDLSAYINETNLRIRVRYFANYWCDGVAIDNIQLFGSRPLTSSFTWTSPSTIDAYLDAATTIPYVEGNTASTVYIKPTQVQLEQNTFSFIATATLSNGCSVDETVSIDNRTKYWTGTVSTDWNDDSNWLPNGVPTSDNCVIIPDNSIISGTGYDAFARNVTVRPTGNLELQSGNNLIVTDWVHVDANGEFEIEDTASLVQINNEANTGEFKINRDSQAMYRYDYTYWSSPITTASGYLLNDLSPDTLGDKFFNWLPTQAGANGNWIFQNPNTTTMTPAVGYAVRAPQTYSTNPSTKVVYSALFSGTANNGDISVPISVGTDANIGAYIGDTVVAADDDQWNLIGNPYPSAIDVVSFLNEAGNSTLLDGTAYLWTHNTAPSSAIPDPFYADFGANYTSNDYASVNSLGSTNTAATGGQMPTQYIASGQGFFVLGLNNGSAVFDNSMRVKNENNNFFRTTNTTANTNNNTIEKHRIWLNLSNNNAAFSQILVGYAEGATLGWDRGLDALSFGGNDVNFYSVIPDFNLTMQGKPLPFDTSDVVPLGFKAVNQGDYRIGIDHVDDLFINQPVFLKDKLLNVVHDMKASPYLFSSDIGTFDDRFEIIYTNDSLSVDDYTIVEGDSIKVISNDKLTILSQSEIINEIVVYDVLGRKLNTYKDLDSNKISLNGIQKANRGLLIQITFSDGYKLFKKAFY